MGYAITNENMLRDAAIKLDPLRETDETAGQELHGVKFGKKHRERVRTIKEVELQARQMELNRKRRIRTW